MKTILFVDDEKNLLLLYKKVFSDEGYNVITCEKPRDAYDVLKKEKIDIIVLDIKLKEGNGIEMLQKIKAEYRNIPVILCTGYSSYKNDFSSWFANAYITKSSDLSELKRAIKVNLERAK